MMFRNALVASALLAGLLAAPSISAEVGQTLNEAEIRAALVGHKVTGKPPQGKKWWAIYMENGTAEYNGGVTGTWVIRNGQFCDFPKGDKEYCRTVIQMKGNKVQLIKEDGSKGSVVSW